MNKDKYNLLINELQKIFNKCDPIGIYYEENNDEYDPEIQSILTKIKIGMDKSQLYELIYREFVYWFDKETVGEKKDYDSLTEEVYKILKKFDMI